MKKFNSKKFYIFILVFTLFLFLVYLFIQKVQNDKPLKVVFLDVGQGDAIYIEAPNKKQVLIDGGRDKRVLTGLSSVMPFADRSLDILIGTHPDADHITGLYHVLDTYRVDVVFEPGAVSESKIYKSFEDRIEDKKIPHMIARRGTDIVIDKKNNIVLKILYPDQNPISWDSNEASVITMLTYGESKVLLTGDSPKEKELYLVEKEALNSSGQESTLKADILKIGHHGSRTSSDEEFLKTVSPAIAIISAGKDNSYGHPHSEVIGLLDSLGIEYLETSKEGNIVCKITKVSYVCK